MRPDNRTHEVFNQPPPFAGHNLFSSDAALRRRWRARRRRPTSRFSRTSGTSPAAAEMAEIARLANENPPKLKLFDATGHRLDRVDFHPAYHQLMATSCKAGLHCFRLDAPQGRLGPGARPPRGTRRALLHGDADGGRPLLPDHHDQRRRCRRCCISRTWRRTGCRRPGARLRPDPFSPRRKSAALTFGMGMTEKQGGTDVRANSTTAEPAGTGGPGAEYYLTGHKWFMSAPMSDAFLVLAQAPGGLSLLPHAALPARRQPSTPLPSSG